MSYKYKVFDATLQHRVEVVALKLSLVMCSVCEYSLKVFLTLHSAKSLTDIKGTKIILCYILHESLLNL